MVFVLHVAVVEGTSGLAGMLVEGERSWRIAESVEGEMIAVHLAVGDSTLRGLDPAAAP